MKTLKNAYNGLVALLTGQKTSLLGDILLPRVLMASALVVGGEPRVNFRKFWIFIHFSQNFLLHCRCANFARNLQKLFRARGKTMGDQKQRFFLGYATLLPVSANPLFLHALYFLEFIIYAEIKGVLISLPVKTLN